MTKLEKLIAKHCPDGVEYLPLGELLAYSQPGKYIVHSTEYDDAYETPVLTAGQTFILGYTDEKDNHYLATKGNPVIIFDDFTTATKWVDFEFKVKSSAMKILTPKSPDTAMIRYVYLAMQCIKYVPTEHTRQWIETYSKFEIPVPPIPVQEEIVRMLDGMVGLIDALESELNARQTQYEHYRRKAFDQTDGEIMTLGDIGHVAMCKRILKSQTQVVGDVPFYKIGTFGKDADAYISEELFDEYRGKFSYPEKGAVLLSAAGTIGRTVVFDGEPAYYQDSNIVWLEHDESKVLNSYLFYWYQTSPWKIPSGGTIERLYNDNILQTQIRVPSLSEQKKIVKQLDVFERLCNSMTEGLPGEIAVRKQQYEYYREKLLSFK